MARAACMLVREGASPHEAAGEAVGLLGARAHGEGGIIVAGPDGRLGGACNPPRMSRAMIRAGMSSAKAAVYLRHFIPHPVGGEVQAAAVARQHPFEAVVEQL